MKWTCRCSPGIDHQRPEETGAAARRCHPTERRSAIMQYLHTMVRISDIDASLDFYCNKLGLMEV
ncbi:MAG: hypothetical protein PVF40_07120, partial [Ectothiorhodospiraceae bacterium]